MLNPIAIETVGSRKPLYESFYFRGTAEDGRTAFWLKHNLLRYRNDPDVWVENALILFDRNTAGTRVIYERERLSTKEFKRWMARVGDWDHIAFNFASGSFFEISRESLRGRLHTAEGEASWNLRLDRSDELLFHLPHERFYRLPWPKKKLLTRDCHLGFSGQLSAAGLDAQGHFVGMNGHNWGTEHAHEYAYANCVEFRDGINAYFDAFSVRLALAGGLLRSPFLSVAALRIDDTWYRFDSLVKAPRQAVGGLSNYHWQVVLTNDLYRLEVDIDGSNPRLEPWVALHYHHPSHRVSVVKNSKFAALRLRLVDRKEEKLLYELTSDRCELETLLPDNLPTNEGYVGIP